jgi:glycosyltransferase involved in cell wall biosynthesis
MRIGIEVCPLSKQLTGIGNYIRGLVELLPRVAPQHDYFVYSNREINLPDSEGAFHRRIDSTFSRVPGSLWILGRCAGLARRDRLDVFWASGALLPSGIPPGTLKVVTVYDMVWLRCPETTTRYNLFIQRMCFRRAVAEADLVLVISRSTQDELIDSLAVPRQKTRLVYPGIADRYKVQDASIAAEFISRKYRVPPRYLATVGIVHPRKNQRFLVEVLRILKHKGQLDCPLLVVGPIGWKNSPLFREIQAAGLTENEIRFLGYMPDEDMPSFYAGAQAFLFPTLYEGFGLPPVEALACGTPVIASDSPCMPEVLGGAAILEPLASPQRFADAIVKVLGDKTLRASMKTEGVRRAQKFSYETSAKQLLGFFEEAQPLRRFASPADEARLPTLP